jgi:uncharacterized protein (DUF362 family)
VKSEEVASRPADRPVCLVSCDDYDPVRVRLALDRAVLTIGGWGRFIEPGRKVVVKPNLLLPGDRRPISTHGSVIRAVVDAVREAGGDPVVFDIPGFGSLRSVAK